MRDELFQEILDKLHELRGFFQKLNKAERWAFLHIACLMAEGMDKRGRASGDE